MPISESQINENARQVAKMADFIAMVYANNAQVTTQLNLFTKMTLAKLAAANLFINLETKAKELQELMQAALVSSQFEQNLDRWIADYVRHYDELDQAATKQNQALFAAQPLGITQHLLNLGMVMPGVWGDSNDIRIILKDELTQPEDISQSGTYILPPIAIVAGLHSSESEKQTPHLALQQYVQTVLERNPNKDITLVMQVNANDGHWMAAQVDLRENKVNSAILWDSLHTTPQALSEKPAYSNMQRAVANITPGIKVKPVAACVQKDSSTCMQRSLQHVLQVKYPAAMQIKPGLKAIRDAQPVEKLDTAVIQQIIANVPTLQEKLLQSESPAQPLFQAPLTPATEKKLAQEVFESFAKTKVLKEVQIHFDAVMAQRLSELYRANRAGQTEESMLQEAWSHAYKTLQHNLRFFKSVPQDSKDKSVTPLIAFKP